MQLLHLLPIFSLALALPVTDDVSTDSETSCFNSWNIQKYRAFDAGTTSPAGGPSAFTDSHVSFLFTDPNFGIQNECSAQAQTGKPLSSLAGYKRYYCAGGDMSFLYFGSSIELQRTGVSCGNATYNERGSTSLSLNFYSLFGGQQCETVTQVNVDISFLEKTSG